MFRGDGKPPGADQRRVVVYMDPKVHSELKSRLAEDGKTVSWWFRSEVYKFLRQRRQRKKRR